MLLAGDPAKNRLIPFRIKGKLVIQENKIKALTVGTADAETEESVFSQKNDADFWGLAAYAAHDFGKLSLEADAGYLASTNDLKGAYAHEKVDASAYTFGVRVDYLAYDAGIQVVPLHRPSLLADLLG